MGTSLRTVLLGVLGLLGAGGCAGDPEPDVECSDAILAMHEEVRVRWSDPNACTTHDDCTRAVQRLECSGSTMLEGCSVVVHRDSTDAFEATLADVGEDLCPRITPGCRGWGDCLPSVPRCVDGRCTGVPEDGVDGGPADAGAADAG